MQILPIQQMRKRQTEDFEVIVAIAEVLLNARYCPDNEVNGKNNFRLRAVSLDILNG